LLGVNSKEEMEKLRVWMKYFMFHGKPGYGLPKMDDIKMSEENTIFVTGLPEKMQHMDLETEFRQFGEIILAKVALN